MPSGSDPVPDGPAVTIVHACLRDGRGGSPTAVLPDAPLSDAERRRIPAAAGTSHAVFVAVTDAAVSLRFFTSAGELPACGHGTVAALALLARDGEVPLQAGGRSFTGRAGAGGAFFDPGPVDVRRPADPGPVLAALGVTSPDAAAGCRVASVGRPRLLVPVPDRRALAALAPDPDRLRDACDRAGLLGCYVHTVPEDGRAAARMFAPSIGVPEDIANANSTACLAAVLGAPVTVDMGDSLGEPATITARTGPLRVGGTARVGRVLTLP
ncbi:PhzF family phenazine biosynthesis protein [Actinomadura parmotrematis]|uniref:PhzF family phenazine biosynthesis protein n=1 Tax=Actinomadura parmotrematis TaxID=2864039 RepID=A0ABS7FRF4_9ACTN|nr:PhzF family phenazine biosynthesis protein [Actinomadura parmotrematis]MBW8482108.1 PhzF family phenazine biosynthesis protein [Actinomadura parmotrematis]